jgi:hypothetical protein
LQEFGVPVRHPFFFLNHFIEVAVQTGPPFVGKGPLSTSATKCARDRPADSTAALSGVDSLIGGIGSRTAYSKFRYFVSLWLSSAFHIFPAILSFFCHIYCFRFFVKIWHQGFLQLKIDWVDVVKKIPPLKLSKHGQCR